MKIAGSIRGQITKAQITLFDEEGEAFQFEMFIDDLTVHTEAQTRQMETMSGQQVVVAERSVMKMELRGAVREPPAPVARKIEAVERVIQNERKVRMEGEF